MTDAIAPAPHAPDFILPPVLCGIILDALRARIGDAPAEAPHGLTVGAPEDPYLRRWFLTPRGDGPAVYLHQFARDDDDRALHDHPWPSIGIILRGGYLEHTPAGVRQRLVGDVVQRAPTDRHRVVLMRDAAGVAMPCWTLFLVGARVRDWGFWCEEGERERFVPWQDFTAGPDGALVGKGCGA
ncbi:MAG: hypothetical protein ACOYOH_28435 [Paracraurococcus sp.]